MITQEGTVAISFLNLPWQHVLVSDFEGGWLHFVDEHCNLLMYFGELLYCL